MTAFNPLILAIVIILSGVVGRAQTVPSLINYQGKLTDASAAPLASGTYGIRVQIWSTASGGRLIWGQEYSSVAVVNGVFNIILGAGGTPVLGAAANDLSLAFTESDRFIGLTVTRGSNAALISNATEITPRQQILSAPYALRASFADTAQNVITASIPKGVVVMWSGTIGSIPAGWALCNGANGTPDLRNRFVVCADADSGGEAMSTYSGSATRSGGSLHHTHSGTTGRSAGWYDPKDGGIDKYPNTYGGNHNIDHDHPFTTNTESTVPVVYYALAFIVKI